MAYHIPILLFLTYSKRLPQVRQPFSCSGAVPDPDRRGHSSRKKFKNTIDIHSHICYIIYRLSLAASFKKRKALLRYNTQQKSRRTAHAPGFLSVQENFPLRTLRTRLSRNVCVKKEGDVSRETLKRMRARRRAECSRPTRLGSNRSWTTGWFSRDGICCSMRAGSWHGRCALLSLQRG